MEELTYYQANLRRVGRDYVYHTNGAGELFTSGENTDELILHFLKINNREIFGYFKDNSHQDKEVEIEFRFGKKDISFKFRTLLEKYGDFYYFSINDEYAEALASIKRNKLFFQIDFNYYYLNEGDDSYED